MSTLSPVILLFLFVSCNNLENKESDNSKPESNIKKVPNSVVDQYYLDHTHSKKSNSYGSVSNGRLINGKLIPFSGNNYQYFDEKSYLSGRAYLNDKVLK